MDDIFERVNGILLPGGFHDISPGTVSPGYDYNKVMKSAEYLVKKVIIAKD